MVAQAAAQLGGSLSAKVLIDLREVRTLFAFTEEFTMGIRVAELLGRAKVASVVPVDRRTGVRRLRTSGGAGSRCSQRRPRRSHGWSRRIDLVDRDASISAEHAALIG